MSAWDHRSRCALLLLSLGASLLTGCGERNQTLDDSASLTADPAPGQIVDTLTPVWPYWPVRLRVHPLTRLVTNARGDAHLLEARIELFDRDDDGVKGVGQLAVELRAAGVSGTDGHAVAGWAVDLADPETNRLHFDQVTRTYLLRLELEPEQLPEHPVLAVEMDTPAGSVLRDAMRLRTR
ncbi:MAG: hypothetical protein KJO43_01725 [Phycisphaerae bacterium]|nr:hypothetical protein [Phycisphaerae bacterium]NNF43805.1 hypothetical protein [Phycisphaerales bacterium]